MSITANRRKTDDVDPQEKAAKRAKTVREEWVHDNISTLVTLKERPVKVVVHNVYGNRFRVNIYTKGKDSDSGVITALALSQSEFLAVDVPQAQAA